MLLQIYIPESWPDSDGMTPLPWALRDASGASVRSGETLLSALPKADEVELIAPAVKVLLTSVAVPARSRRKLLQLLPYAVEEKLMYDPESIHTAPATSVPPSGEVALAAIDKGWLGRTLELLAKAGLQPRKMWPETLLPPLLINTWTAIWNGHEGLLRTGALSGSSLDGGNADTPPLALLLAAQEAKMRDAAPGKIILRLAGDAEQPDLARWSAQLGVETQLGAAWDWRQAPHTQEPGINLLQGGFAASSAGQAWLPRLRPALIVAGLIVLVQFGGTLVDWAQLSYQERHLKADMQASFRKAFPEAKVIVDAPLQMQRNLADLRHAAGVADASDFLPLLAQVTPILADAGQFEAVQYERGTLKLDLALRATQNLETLRNRLRNTGIKAELEKLEGGNAATTKVRIALTGGRL